MSLATESHYGAQMEDIGSSMQGHGKEYSSNHDQKNQAESKDMIQMEFHLPARIAEYKVATMATSTAGRLLNLSKQFTPPIVQNGISGLFSVARFLSRPLDPLLLQVDEFSCHQLDRIESSTTHLLAPINKRMEQEKQQHGPMVAGIRTAVATLSNISGWSINGKKEDYQQSGGPTEEESELHHGNKSSFSKPVSQRLATSSMLSVPLAILSWLFNSSLEISRTVQQRGLKDTASRMYGLILIQVDDLLPLTMRRFNRMAWQRLSSFVVQARRLVMATGSTIFTRERRVQAMQWFQESVFPRFELFTNLIRRSAVGVRIRAILNRINRDMPNQNSSAESTNQSSRSSSSSSNSNDSSASQRGGEVIEKYVLATSMSTMATKGSLESSGPKTADQVEIEGLRS